MSNDFYEFYHECNSMPIEMSIICKIKGSEKSQAAFMKYIEGVGRFEVVLYGFEFCPYCGEKLGDAS